MKREKIHEGFLTVLLSVAIAAAGIGCISTGFGIRIDSFPRILGIMILCAGSFALIQGLRCGGLIFAALGILAVSGLLRHTQLLTSIEALLYKITLFYDQAYGWGFIRWSEESLRYVSVDDALALIGCLISLGVSACMLAKTWVIFGVIPSLMPLFACCVVTDTVPDVTWIWLLFAWLMLLILTQLVRRGSSVQGNRMTAALLIPVMLFSTLLFYRFPEKDFEEQSKNLRNAMQSFTEKLVELFHPLDIPVDIPGDGIGPGIGPGTSLEISTSMDLTNAGPMSFSGNEVLEFSAPWMKSFYLRGRSYDTYTGTGWEAKWDTVGENGWPQEGMAITGTVTVWTKSAASLRYFPYYVADRGWMEELKDGALENPEELVEYSFPLMVPVNILDVTKSPLSQEEKEVYLSLPEETAAAAEKILQELFSSHAGHTPGEMEMVLAIENYVYRLAEYSLAAEKMPEGETDFALWFITEAESGYCVHYASAATVLLRAAGIPARYVTGYRASSNGATTTVTDEQAHAWVEFYNPNQGWTVLDPTPGVGNTPEERPTEPPETTSPPETTLPPETTVPPETTLPSETTVPPETTLPSETTRPPTETTLPTDTADPTEPGQTVKPTTGDSEQKKEPQKEWNLRWIKGILWILGIWAALLGQDRLRKLLRRRRLQKGTRNRQAVARWKYARWLSRLSGHSAEELRPLAEKAVFSQHALSEEELAKFDEWFAEAKQNLKKNGWLLEHLIRWLFAVE